MSESFDVVVVGSRCAGAPLATMLARAGVRVCVVDRDRFPSDTLSTHAIQPVGVQVLERLVALDALLKVAPPIVRGRMALDDLTGEHLSPSSPPPEITQPGAAGAVPKGEESR